jgi:hypothetical protein
MTRKLCTIFFPSRGRLDLTKKLLESIENKTSNKQWIEVIAICDQDDTDTIELFTKISKEVTYDFYFICRKRKNKLHLPNDYYSLALKIKSKSFFTWGLGNDNEIITQNWDTILFKSIKNTIPDCFTNIHLNTKYYYLIINDNSHWSKEGNISKEGDYSCCFPILSGNYCDDSNETVPNEYPTWQGDIALYALVIKSPKFQVINAVDLIEINHYCHHNNTYEKDNVALCVEKSSGDDAPPYTHKNLEKMYLKRKYLYE